MQQEFAKEVLKRLPLAEAVLHLWQWVCEPTALEQLFKHWGSPCYTDVLTFPVLVSLVRDALLQHGGSALQAFERGIERGELLVSVQAAYGKLGRLPLPLSEAFLAESGRRLAAVFPPATTTGEVPASLVALTAIIIDGKAGKKLPKRLQATRGCSGGVLGGKAVVALEPATGLALAMASDADGETNDSKLGGPLLPQVRQQRQNILWIADAQFCDPLQIQQFLERAGDHVLLRYSKKNRFFADELRVPQTGTDLHGRTYQEEWGWLGISRNKHRRYVRRITLERPGEDAVILVTDLLDETKYPASDLLEMYLRRWGIERVFQQITEVFSLEHLIGTTPQGTLFQLAFCLLLYNMIQVVRAYVAQGAEEKIGNVSTELLFDDVRRQQIALFEMLELEQVSELFATPLTPQALRVHLQRLLQPLWTERWRKAPPKKRTAAHPKQKRRHHNSVFRILNEHKAQKAKQKAKKGGP